MTLLHNVRFAGERLLRLGRTTPKSRWFSGAHGAARAQLLRNIEELQAAPGAAGLAGPLGELLDGISRNDVSAVSRFNSATEGWVSR